MRSWTRRPVSLVLALALLAGLGVMLVGESFFHTDDGCAVETHCLTCTWAAGSIAVITPDVTPALALEPHGYVAATPAIAALETPSCPESSRGPPQA
jgi:hypothetical protein